MEWRNQSINIKENCHVEGKIGKSVKGYCDDDDDDDDCSEISLIGSSLTSNNSSFAVHAFGIVIYLMRRQEEHRVNKLPGHV